MNSFLHLLAKDLIQKYSYNFDNLTILFPNKRAGLFLAQELAQLIDRPVWMPGLNFKRIDFNEYIIAVQQVARKDYSRMERIIAYTF